MGGQAMDAVSKTLGRITKTYFILIAVIVAMIVFAANYLPPTSIGAVGQHFRQPFQEYILLKTEESSIEKCLTKANDTAVNNEIPSDQTKSKQTTPLEFPITDHSLIHPPPAPADDEEYIAVCESSSL